MSKEAIRALLQKQMGLDPSSLGNDVIDRAIKDRMTACAVNDSNIYEDRLRRSDELQALINAVIVPETWFFRDGEPFRYMQHHAISKWWPQNPGRKLRALSIPCSTGEEPYSIAMALMDGGLSPISFTVDAVDISTRSLEKAKRAIYGMHSFRGADISFRERHFKQSGTEYILSDSVSQVVNFIHGNLLDPLFLADREPYDVVFCRNLLIYFDALARESAARALFRLMKKDALLFVGHAEALEMFTPLFESVRHPHAFAYRLKRNMTKKITPEVLKIDPLDARKLERARKGITTTRIRTAPLKTKILKEERVRKEEPPKQDNTVSLLMTARQLADQGKLQEAMLACEYYLIKSPADAEAHCLRGIIAEAQGNAAKAEEYYNRALYLRNDYYEAMIHLILLLEGRGEHQRAQVMRERAERMKSKH